MSSPSFVTPAPLLAGSDEAGAALLRRARRRVGLKTGFATHALVYLLVNLGLAAAAAWHGGTSTWRLGPLLGWGLGLAIHGIVVLANLYGDGLRDGLLRSEVERLRRRR